MSNLRYFRTEQRGYLYWKWNEEKGQLWFSCEREENHDDPDVWKPSEDQSPDELNGAFVPGHRLYAIETDKNWEPLPKPVVQRHHFLPITVEEVGQAEKDLADTVTLIGALHSDFDLRLTFNYASGEYQIWLDGKLVKNTYIQAWAVQYYNTQLEDLRYA